MRSAVVALTLVGLTAASCSDLSTGPSPLTGDSDFGSMGSMLSGTVFETTPEGPRPLQSGLLFLTYNGNRLERPIDSAGRYTARNLRDGATVSVEVAGAGTGAGHQPCAAIAVIHGDTVLDVEYNPLHVRGTGGSPRLSGTVSIVLGSAREPLRAVKVQYLNASTVVAYTFTDDEGRYELCRLPTGTGRLEVTDATPWDYGGPYAKQDLNISGDVALDIEIRR